MNANKPYKVVQVPTALGIVSGLAKAKVVGEFENKEDAEECAYLEFADEPAPDKRDYYSIKVIEYR